MREPEDKAEKLARLDQGFVNAIPHNRALGLRFLDFAEGEAKLALPYDEKLVGNPLTGVLHGGAVTSMLDAACGAAVFMKLERPSSIATLDLRIDYLKQAAPGCDVVCKARCYKVTRHVAFVRGIAYHDDENDPIATCQGTFIVQSKGRPIVQRDA